MKNNEQKEQEPIFLTAMEYQIAKYMMNNGIFSSRKIAKEFNMNKRQIDNVIYRIITRYNVNGKIDLVYGLLTGKLPPFKQKKYAEKPIKPVNKDDKIKTEKKKPIKPQEPKSREYTPEELRRMNLMRKMGFSEAEIIKEIR